MFLGSRSVSRLPVVRAVMRWRGYRPAVKRHMTTNLTCERSRASGTIRPTLKAVHFTTPSSSAWPLDILHFGKLAARLIHQPYGVPGDTTADESQLRERGA